MTNSFHEFSRPATFNSKDVEFDHAKFIKYNSAFVKQIPQQFQRTEIKEEQRIAELGRGVEGWTLLTKTAQIGQLRNVTLGQLA